MAIWEDLGGSVRNLVLLAREGEEVLHQAKDVLLSGALQGDL